MASGSERSIQRSICWKRSVDEELFTKFGGLKHAAGILLDRSSRSLSLQHARQLSEDYLRRVNRCVLRLWRSARAIDDFFALAPFGSTAAAYRCSPRWTRR